MKNSYLVFAFIVFFSQLNAQIEIYKDSIGVDLSGTIVDIDINNLSTFPHKSHFFVKNLTGADQQWRITRVRQNVPSTWDDDVCWPPQCFLTGPGDSVYNTPNTMGSPAPTIIDGTWRTTLDSVLVQNVLTPVYADLSPQIHPDISIPAVALYMYYITDVSGNRLDSLGLRYNYTVGVQELPELVVQVSPNPADDLLTISRPNAHNGTVQIIDVLGNVVLRDAFIGISKTIDVRDFTNGIYFVRVEAPGLETYNRRFVIKH